MHSFQLAAIFMVFGLPALAWAGSDMFKRWLKYREAVTAVLATQTAEKAAQYATKVERLEQRMAVMERILTDRSATLGDEIERLRDAPIN